MVGQTMLPLEPLTAGEAAEVVGGAAPGGRPSTAIDARRGRRPRGTRCSSRSWRPRSPTRPRPEELPDDRARGDRCADRRAARRVRGPRCSHASRDRADVLARRARGDRRARRRGRRAGSARGPRPRAPALAEPGRRRRRVRFKHVLIRDVAYGTLPRGAPARTPRRAIARYLEDSDPDPTELGWVLAHHWREAGEPARAIDVPARGRASVPETPSRWRRRTTATRGRSTSRTDEAERRRILLRRGVMLAKVERVRPRGQGAHGADPGPRRPRGGRGAACRSGSSTHLDGADRARRRSLAARADARRAIRRSTSSCRSALGAARARRTRCAASAATWRARSSSARRPWICGREGRHPELAGSTTSTSTATPMYWSGRYRGRTSWRCRRSAFGGLDGEQRRVRAARRRHDGTRARGHGALRGGADGHRSRRSRSRSGWAGRTTS